MLCESSNRHKYEFYARSVSEKHISICRFLTAKWYHIACSLSLPQFGSHLNWIMIWRKLSTSNKYCVYANDGIQRVEIGFDSHTNANANTEVSSQEHNRRAMNDRRSMHWLHWFMFRPNSHTHKQTSTRWLMINANEHQDNGMLCRMWYNRFARVRMQKTNLIGFSGCGKASSSGNGSRLQPFAILKVEICCSIRLGKLAEIHKHIYEVRNKTICI